VLLTLMRVKNPEIRNLYVLVLFSACTGKQLARRRVPRTRFDAIRTGDVLRIGGAEARVTSTATRTEHRGDGSVAHVREVFTAPLNVVRMPSADEETVVEQFLRYHVLIRVFHGDPDAWLAHLQERGEDADADVRFARWIRSRMREDPTLIASIRRMVDATPFWRAAEA
jgi:hypothetical protein